VRFIAAKNKNNMMLFHNVKKLDGNKKLRENPVKSRPN